MTFDVKGLIMDSKVFITALMSCPGIGNKTFKDILEYFEDAETAWNSLSKYYAELGLSQKQMEIFNKHRSDTSLAKVHDQLSKMNISVITYSDVNYPFLLKEIYNQPSVLFVRGKIPRNELTIAIVGTRKPTPYGKMIAEKLAEELAAYDVTIVSGLARGIDTFAHKGALLKGSTIAVLGCGVDTVYPPENAQLMHNIIENGAVISEFPPGTPPQAGHFPARNRIISGLSQGVLVVEAAERSGSLITSDFALEQGRDVFAVPGPITSKNSVGCHYLIKNGAKLTAKALDILEEYGFSVTIQEQVNNHSTIELLVLDLLSHIPVHLEEILANTKFEIGKLSKILINLELANSIKQLPGQYYILNNVNMR